MPQTFTWRAPAKFVALLHFAPACQPARLADSGHAAGLRTTCHASNLRPLPDLTADNCAGGHYAPKTTQPGLLRADSLTDAGGGRTSRSCGPHGPARRRAQCHGRSRTDYPPAGPTTPFTRCTITGQYLDTMDRFRQPTPRRPSLVNRHTQAVPTLACRYYLPARRNL